MGAVRQVHTSWSARAPVKTALTFAQALARASLLALFQRDGPSVVKEDHLGLHGGAEAVGKVVA